MAGAVDDNYAIHNRHYKRAIRVLMEDVKHDKPGSHFINAYRTFKAEREQQHGANQQPEAAEEEEREAERARQEFGVGDLPDAAERRENITSGGNNDGEAASSSSGDANASSDDAVEDAVEDAQDDPSGLPAANMLEIGKLDKWWKQWRHRVKDAMRIPGVGLEDEDEEEETKESWNIDIYFFNRIYLWKLEVQPEIYRCFACLAEEMERQDWEKSLYRPGRIKIEAPTEEEAGQTSLNHRAPKESRKVPLPYTFVFQRGRDPKLQHRPGLKLQHRRGPKLQHRRGPFCRDGPKLQHR